jgi:hypothetical protein
MKEALRERLNARLGDELIRDIYFVSGSMTRREAEAAKEAVTSKPIAVPLLPHIQNPELATVFRRIVRAHARRPTQTDRSSQKGRTPRPSE